jgi:hypothetical protein
MLCEWGPVECQLKMTNVQGGQAPAIWQKMFENSCMKTVAEQSTGSETSLGSVVEFARRS